MRASGEKISTLKIRVKWRLSIWCHRPPVSFQSGASRLPHRTKGRSRCVALILSSPPERHHCCRRPHSPPTCRSPPPPYVRAAAGRGFRRLVSARRHRHEQSAREEHRHARCSQRSAALRPCGPASTPPASSASASAISSTTGSAVTSPASIAATRISTAPTTHRSAACRLGANNYTGSKSEWVVMANGYVDLGTWWCVTPFIGAGVGMARTTSREFHRRRRRSITASAPATSCRPCAARSKWNFAWALHAGLAYKVKPASRSNWPTATSNLGDGVDRRYPISTASRRGSAIDVQGHHLA